MYGMDMSRMRSAREVAAECTPFACECASLTGVENSGEAHRIARRVLEALVVPKKEGG